MPPDPPPDPLGVLLISPGHERAQYAFMLAVAAAAIGRPAVLFATNEGCRALAADWSGVAGADRDATIRARGVAGLDELRAAAAELGVRLLACEAGLRMAGLALGALLPRVEIAGIPAFLAATRGGQTLTV